MALLQSVTNPITKNLPKAHGLVSAGVVGVGSYSIARWLDGMIGNRIQSIGVGLPVIGSLSLLDVLMILAFKSSMHKNSQVAAAFLGDRVFNLRFGIPGLSSLANALPSGAKNNSTSLSGPVGGGL